MAEFHIEGDKCKSLETAIKKVARQLKEFQSAYIDFQFKNGETHVLVVRNLGNRIECDSTSAARIFNELFNEAFYQSKKE